MTVKNEGIFEKVARTVRDTRRVSGMTQSELARLAGVGKTAVFDIENGKRTVQWETLLKVLQALNIQIQILSPVNIACEESET